MSEHKLFGRIYPERPKEILSLSKDEVEGYLFFFFLYFNSFDWAFLNTYGATLAIIEVYKRFSVYDFNGNVRTKFPAYHT